MVTPAAQALDAERSPTMYVHPSSLRILAANTAAANDLGCSKNELTTKTLSEVLEQPNLANLVENIGPAAHSLRLSSRCCEHWQLATLSTVGEDGGCFLKVRVQRRPESDPVDTCATAHDTVARELMQHALGLLCDEGCRNFSVRKVARRAGVGLGHLQHYYRPKIRLLEAMTDAITFELIHYYERWVVPLPAPGARLVALIDFASNQRKHGKWLVLLREFRTLARDDQELRSLLGSLYRECIRVFHQMFLSINPTLSPVQLQSIANEALSLLSDADEFVGHMQDTHGNSTDYRTHLTARILGLVHGDQTKTAANPDGFAAVHVGYIRELLGIATDMARLPSRDQKLQALCAAGARILNSQNVSIFLGAHGRFRGSYNTGNPPDIEASFHQFVIKASEPTVARAIVSGTCEVAHKAGADPDNPSDVAIFSLLESVVVVALHDRGGIPCGCIAVGYTHHLPHFSSLQAELLQGLAGVIEPLLHGDTILAS